MAVGVQKIEHAVATSRPWVPPTLRELPGGGVVVTNEALIPALQRLVTSSMHQVRRGHIVHGFNQEVFIGNGQRVYQITDLDVKRRSVFGGYQSAGILSENLVVSEITIDLAGCPTGEVKVIRGIPRTSESVDAYSAYFVHQESPQTLIAMAERIETGRKMARRTGVLLMRELFQRS